jgi:hypothetical protein
LALDRELHELHRALLLPLHNIVGNSLKLDFLHLVVNDESQQTRKIMKHRPLD